MRNLTRKRDREVWIFVIIIAFAFLAVAVFPKKIDEGVVWALNIGNFNMSFGLQQTIDYIIEIPSGWLSLEMRFVLSASFAFLSLFFSFLLGKVWFEGNNPLRVTQIKHARYLTPSRYFSDKGRCRFSVIVTGGETLDLCGEKGDLIADVGVNDEPRKKFNKVPGMKGELLAVGRSEEKKRVIEHDPEHNDTDSVDMGRMSLGAT